MTDTRRAVVVGAGIVGICTGLELQRRGWSVTVVDRLATGTGCSFGNAGILASMAVVPVGLPGFERQLPRMLLDPDSPLVIRWRALPQTLPWLLHFRRAATAERIPHAADAMHTLYRSSVALHRALADEAGVPELVRAHPGLYVHRNPDAIDLVNGLAWKLRRERGAEIEVLDAADLRDAEPELSPAYTRGVRVGPMGFTTNPLRLVQSYGDLFLRRGGRVLRASVLRLRPAGAIVTVDTTDTCTDAETVVIAAGAWTRALVEPLGLALPLIAERGYHMTFADPAIALRHVVTELEMQFAVTSMETGLRVAGTEELGHADDPPLWRRADILQKHARRMFPRAQLENGTRWMGPRPGMPDSLPAIGALPGLPNILVAAGHGHLGLTGAPHTGRIVAALASGEAPGIAMAPFAPDRFARPASGPGQARRA
jgi:D-amino-acid dehydrogenase